MSSGAYRVLDESVWVGLALEHEVRVSQFTESFLERRSLGEKHPVEDFLFTYYKFTPGKLKFWHPGFGVVLLGGAAEKYLGRKFYRAMSVDEKRVLGVGSGVLAVTCDVELFLCDRGEAVDYVVGLLGVVNSRRKFLGCFGLHEWAMVYRQSVEDLRHRQLSLRLGVSGTSRVVEESNIRCSHYDAYRFFTPSAEPLNLLRPTFFDRKDFEQPGCLHVNMDVYKFAYKFVPVVSADFVLECFELARKIRVMDMRASPYDLRHLGYDPICVESGEGRSEYVGMQREFGDEASLLRVRLLDILQKVVV